jgi:DNA replication and repair protein RecF
VRLRRLHLTNFRNYTDLDLSFGDEVQVVYGQNAQGKTNLLEAIHYLALLRTFRGGTSKDLVRFGQQQHGMRVRGEVVGPLGLDQLEVKVTPEGRKITVNEKDPGSVADYLKVLSVVRFVPDDILLLKGSSEPRRKMLDRAVFALQTAHLQNLQSYNRALSQKNRLLRTGQFHSAHIDVWNDEMAKLGAQVMASRLWYLDAINPLVTDFFRDISGSDVRATVSYKTKLGGSSRLPRDPEGLEATFRLAMDESAQEEARRGFSVVGPHRDDMKLEVDAHALRNYGSQGQHRMFALALKVAEIVLHQQEKGDYPVLLLDDVRSELDAHRVRYLFTFLNKIEAQIFVTSTDFREISDELTRPAQWWRVTAGILTEEAPGAEH